MSSGIAKCPPGEKLLLVENLWSRWETDMLIISEMKDQVKEHSLGKGITHISEGVMSIRHTVGAQEKFIRSTNELPMSSHSLVTITIYLAGLS